MHIPMTKSIFIMSFFIFSPTMTILSSDREHHTQVVGQGTSFYHTKSQSFENFVRWSNEKSKIAEEILKNIGEPKDSLLDIGAGDGALTMLLASHFSRIVAIEPGFHMFTILSKTCNGNTYELINTAFEKYDSKDQFDIILCSHSFRFLSNHLVAVRRINDLLKDDGLFLLIDVSPESDFWKFYHAHEKDLLGTISSVPDVLDYNILLKEIFNVKEIHFTATLSIPSTDEAVKMLDFLFNVDFNKIKKEALAKTSHDLHNKYGDGPVVINFQQIMYVCSKKSQPYELLTETWE